MYKIVKEFMMKRRKNKSLAIGILCCMLVFMGIGYAALSQVLKVTTTGNVTGQWKIYIDSVDLNTVVGTDTGKITDPTKATSSIIDEINATTNVSFNEPGEYALYDIVVKNEGNIDAELKNINLTTEANLDNFDVETIGLGTGTKNLKNNPTFSGVNLLANNELSFQLKITFDKDKDLTELPSPDTEYKFTISMNYVQKTSNTSGGDGGTTDDPNAPDFTVDENGKIVAYNSSKIVTDSDGYLIVPATNSEGKTITSIDRSSFAKSNITMVYDITGCYIDAATEEEYLKIKARVEESMNGDGSGSDSELIALESMAIYWTKEKEIPTDAEEITKYYFNSETNEIEESVTQFEKVDLTQATSLEEIGNETFSESPITSIKFNEGLKRIGENAFENSQLSGSIKFPSTLESIGDYAFTDSDLEEISKFSNKLKTIGDYAFFKCVALTSIGDIPSSLTYIGQSAFGQTPNLTTITIKKSDSTGMTLGNGWNGNATVVYDPN